MSNKKNLCPECKVNMKGIKSKQCKSCNTKALVAKKKSINAAINESKENTKVNNPPAEDSTPRVGATTPDGKFYL